MRRNLYLSLFLLIMLCLALFYNGHIFSNPENIKFNDKILTDERWLKLRTAVPPVVVGEQGRSNPFVAVNANENTKQQDQEKILAVNAVRFALEKYKTDHGKYPVGSRLSLGSAAAYCLSALGWQGREQCIIPANPAANVLYLSSFPDFSNTAPVQYSALMAGADYTMEFSLQSETALGAAGEFEASAAGVTKRY